MKHQNCEAHKFGGTQNVSRRQSETQKLCQTKIETQVIYDKQKMWQTKMWQTQNVPD